MTKFCYPIPIPSSECDFYPDRFAYVCEEMEAAAALLVPQSAGYDLYEPQYPTVTPDFPIQSPPLVQSPPGASYNMTPQGSISPRRAIVSKRRQKLKALRRPSILCKSLTSIPPSWIALVSAPTANTGRGVPYVPQQAQLARPMIPSSMSEQSQVTIEPGRVGIPSPYGYSLEGLGDVAPQIQDPLHGCLIGVLHNFRCISLNTHATLPTDRDPSVQLEGDQERLCI